MSVESIDPGEAQIFAVAAEGGGVVITGDKRALRALKNISEFVDVLQGRVVILEAALMALCHRLGEVEVRGRMQPVLPSDKMVQICFSPGNSTPLAALVSYYQDVSAELAPLVLWNPQPGDVR